VELCRAQVALLRGDRAAAQKHLHAARRIFGKQGIRMWEWKIEALRASSA